MIVGEKLCISRTFDVQKRIVAAAINRGNTVHRPYIFPITTQKIPIVVVFARHSLSEE